MAAVCELAVSNKKSTPHLSIDDDDDDDESTSMNEISRSDTVPRD